jgi:5'-nucleotidase
MPSKFITYVDMDHVLCDYSSGFKRHQSLYPHLTFPQSQPGLYVNLEPMPGAIAAYEWLDQHPRLDVYILTAPSIRNPHSYSEKRIWVEKYLGIGAVNKLIISPNKGLNRGSFLIDDYIQGKGQENFEGRIIQFGSAEFSDWPAVIGFFKRCL